MSDITSGDNPILYPVGLGAANTLNESTADGPASEALISDEFPTLRSAADLPDAWEAAIASNDPDGARDRLVRIAFNNGWEESLPAAAREWVGGCSGGSF